VTMRARKGILAAGSVLCGFSFAPFSSLREILKWLPAVSRQDAKAQSTQSQNMAHLAARLQDWPLVVFPLRIPIKVVPSSYFMSSIFQAFPDFSSRNTSSFFLPRFSKETLTSALPFEYFSGPIEKRVILMSCAL